ncbi:MAG: acyltransferase family protein [Microgenomates group bacterium]
MKNQNNSTRIFFIDNLRGLAILAMMMIHATAYFLNDKLAYFVWDNLEWAVPVFVFCSFYLSFQKHIYLKGNQWLGYFKKRLKRLLFPYFVFLLVYFFLIYFFEPNKFNLDYFLANIFLFGGVDFNWLVLLFIYFMFLTPIFVKIFQNKFFKIIYFILVISASLFFIFFKINYRLIIWLPWSFYLFLIAMFIKEDNKKIILMTVLSFFSFLLLGFLEIKIGHNLSQYSNKYPPTLYHLTFGSFWIGILYFIFKNQENKFLRFFSINSYSLYFIHFLVLLLIVWFKIIPNNWFLFFLEIFSGSVIIQKLLNHLNLS